MLETYDQSRKGDTKDQSICNQDPNVIIALDDPFWKSNTIVVVYGGGDI